MSGIPKDYHTIVIGAGVAGLGVAAGLAEKGKKVLVLNKKLLGEASPASAGILDPFLEMKPGHSLFSLCRNAFQRYPAFLKKIGNKNLSYQKTGMLYVALNAAEEKELNRRYAWQKKTGIPARLVSRQAILKSNPGVSVLVRSGLFYPSIGRLQPPKLLAAWKAYLKRRGVDFLEVDQASRLLIASQKAAGVEINGKPFHAQAVVNAAGSWAGHKSMHIPAPVLPARGQIMVVCGKVKINTILHSLDGGYVVPWGKNRYLVGSNVEFCGFKPKVTEKGLRSIWSRNRRILPGLEKCKRTQVWAGLRPYSKKRLPLIGATRVRGLYLAAGYYRSGILISAHVGKLLAKGIVSGKMPSELKPFQPKNFGL
jgi:glycine oxidase